MSHGTQGAVTQDAEEGSGGCSRNLGEILHNNGDRAQRLTRNAEQWNEKKAVSMLDSF